MTVRVYDILKSTWLLNQVQCKAPLWSGILCDFSVLLPTIKGIDRMASSHPEADIWKIILWSSEKHPSFWIGVVSIHREGRGQFIIKPIFQELLRERPVEGNSVMNLSNKCKKKKKNYVRTEEEKTPSNTVEGNPVPKELNIHYRFLKIFFFLYKNNTAKGHTSQETLSL